MTAGDYLAGLPFLLLTYGSVAAATEIAVRRRLPRLRGATRVVAWAMLATAGLLATHLVPAALTVLSRESVTVAAVLLALLVALLVRPSPDGGPDGDPVPSPPTSRAERLLGFAGVAAAALWFTYTLIRYRTHEPLGFDAAGAYLPTAARWLQDGSIWQIADWIPNAFYGSGPGNGSVVVLSTMLPWDNDFLSHLAMYPYVALFAVCLYALARELGAPWPQAALLGTMVAAAPVVVQHGLSEGLLDPLMYASLAAGVLFLVRHNRTAARADLLLAGLALGICFGTKFYGYTTVAAVVVVWVGARLACRVRPAVVARETLTVGLLVLAAGGIWMARNWVETGNPLMPVRIEILGATIFDAPPDPQRGIFGFTLLDYVDRPSVWFDTLAHQFRVAVGWSLILLTVAVGAAAGLLAHRRRKRAAGGSDRVAWALLAGTVLLLAVYAATPYTGAGPEGEPLAAAINVRYGIPAAIAGVGLIGWLAGRISPGWRTALAAAALVGTIDALRVGPVNRPSVAWICLLLGVVAAGAWAAVDEPRPRIRLPSPRPAAVAAALVAVLVAGALAGYVLERAFNDDRYTGIDPALDYVIETSDDGITVGLAGFWNLEGVVPVYPSFGPRLENEVEFIGGHLDDALLRRHDSSRSFIGKLRGIDPDLLVVGRAGPDPEFDPDRNRTVPDDAELRWARSAGYREVARSDRFIVLEREPADVS